MSESKKKNEALKQYLSTNVYDFMTTPGIANFSPETIAYIEREARKSKLLAALRGAAVNGTLTATRIPGELLDARNLRSTLKTYGAWPVVYAPVRLAQGTIGGAIDYYKSRARYKELRDYLMSLQEEDVGMAKEAAKINYGGMLARRVAREGKHSSGALVQIIPSAIDDSYTRGTITGRLRKDDIKAQLYKKILEKMEEQNPEELKNVVVHLGGTRNISDALRTITNRKVGIFSRIGNVIRLPGRLLTSTVGNVARGDHYDPMSNAVVLYDDNPAVLTHELGHAIDYNRYKGWGRWRKNFNYALNAVKDEAEANKVSEEAIVNAFKDNPKVLSALQALRMRTLPRGYYTYNTEGGFNPYKGKTMKSILSSGKIGHEYVMDEHVNLPTRDLIEILRNELLDEPDAK